MDSNYAAWSLETLERLAAGTDGRHHLLGYCQWNDANGDYDDWTLEELLGLVRHWFEEGC